MNSGSFGRPPLVEQERPRGRVTFVNPTPGLCAFCGEPLPPYHRNACARTACQRKLKTATQQKRLGRNVPKEPKARLQCPGCLAYDDEVSFETLDCCMACYQQRMRYGSCEKCKSFMHSDGCYRCSPPEFNVEVLWACEDGRLRKLYRRIRDGYVIINKKSYRVKTNPLSIVVEVKTWLTTRN